MGRPVLMWVLDYLSITKEDSIFLAVPAPILKQYDIKKMLARMLPQVGKSGKMISETFFVVDVGEMECLEVNFLVGKSFHFGDMSINHLPPKKLSSEAFFLRDFLVLTMAGGKVTKTCVS